MMNNMTTGSDIKGTSNKRLVPELRFPDFEKEGEWKNIKLENIAEFYKGKGISKNDISNNGKTPCIRYGELYTFYKEIVRKVKSYTNLPIENLFFSKANDVIIPSSGETKEDISTASCILCDNIALGGDINVIRASHHNGVFLSYYLNNAKKNDIAQIAQGISIIHLHNSQLQKLLITIPSLAEQQKIAECLSSIDEEISAMKEKAEQLKIHKKGLMQKLFPVAGKFVPELRFPEFEKKWGKNVLKTIIMTIIPPKKLQTTEYHKKGMFPIIDQSQSFICGFSDDESALVNKKKEDIVIFGDHTCILKLANFTFIQGADGIKIFKSSNPDIVRTDYIYHYLNTFPIGIKEYKRHYSELKEIIVCYSDSIKEQQKIAECLSSIDELISLYENKVTLLEQHKKGLMQQLFPNL